MREIIKCETSIFKRYFDSDTLIVLYYDSTIMKSFSVYNEEVGINYWKGIPHALMKPFILYLISDCILLELLIN